MAEPRPSSTRPKKNNGHEAPGFPPPPPPEACDRMLKEMPAEPSTEDVRRLVSALATERWSLRDRIAKHLAGMGPAVVPVLLEMLETGLWYSRAATLKSLGRIADPRSLLPVLDACWDTNQTVVEEALRALVDYCRLGRALAVAKILHSRGPILRDDLKNRLEQVEPDAAQRLEILWAERDLMGAESRLKPVDELNIARHVRDSDWGLVWDEIVPSEPMRVEKKSVLDRLRELGKPAPPNRGEGDE